MRTRRHTLLATLLALAATIWLLSGVRASADAGPVVVSDGQASTDPYGTAVIAGNATTSGADAQPNTEVEPSIAVNPADSSNVVTGYQVGRVDGGGDADNGFATTFDGGKSWSYGNLPAMTKNAPDCPNSSLAGCSFDRGSDASVAFGKASSTNLDCPGYKGYIVYINSLVFDDVSDNGLASGMAVNVSCDGGKNWKDATILEQDQLDGLNDKNWIIADNGTGATDHPGRVYVVWDKVLASLAYSYCDPDVAAPTASRAGCDLAANWSSVNNNSWYTLSGVIGIGAFPVVLTDGSLGVAFYQEDAAACSITDTENGTCFGAGGASVSWVSVPGAGAVAWPLPLATNTLVPVTITQYDSNGVNDQRAGGLPQAAVDPTTDTVYVVWEDNRDRKDLNGGPGNQNDPVMAVSSPVGNALPGVVWSSVIRVDASASQSDQVDRYNPTVAVGADGIVRVAYRQRDENPSSGFNAQTGRGTPIDTYYQESRDGGQTFSAPLKVDTMQDTPDAGYGAFDTTNVQFGLFEGDYEQIAAAGDDQSYVARDEAYAGDAAASPRDFASNELPSDAQWQQTWVAQIAPQPADTTPETPLVPMLALAGAVGIAIWGRRRLHRT